MCGTALSSCTGDHPHVSKAEREGRLDMALLTGKKKLSLKTVSGVTAGERIYGVRDGATVLLYAKGAPVKAVDVDALVVSGASLVGVKDAPVTKEVRGPREPSKPAEDTPPVEGDPDGVGGAGDGDPNPNPEEGNDDGTKAEGASEETPVAGASDAGGAGGAEGEGDKQDVPPVAEETPAETPVVEKPKRASARRAAKTPPAKPKAAPKAAAKAKGK